MIEKTFLYDNNDRSVNITNASKFRHIVVSDSGEMLQEHTGIINRKS